MHHFVFGINLQIHSVSLTSFGSIHRLIDLSTRLSHHPRSHHPFPITLSLQAQSLPFQQILTILDFFYLLGCLRDNGTIPHLSCSSFYL